MEGLSSTGLPRLVFFYKYNIIDFLDKDVNHYNKIKLNKFWKSGICFTNTKMEKTIFCHLFKINIFLCYQLISKTHFFVKGLF